MVEMRAACNCLFRCPAKIDNETKDPAGQGVNWVVGVRPIITKDCERSASRNTSEACSFVRSILVGQLRAREPELKFLSELENLLERRSKVQLQGSGS
ncbi:uncharacterized protein LOC143208885 isoform X1 [Lasioglossum baleicum]|uniref:uncharacterized protein LOC143208885 isoform X1 n=1 Tax=Lasioglossum baleicum TaxID=434251 RepID=UPI003FCC5ECC